MDTVQTIINYYVNLLIFQYFNMPKARATIAALLSQVIANGIALDVLNGYDVYTAIGVQLDILGKYADINRFYTGQNLTGYFGFSTYTNHAPTGTLGFSTYSNFLPPKGKWLLYSGILGQNNSLTDDQFRQILLLRIIQNNCNFSRQSIDAALFNTFGLDVIPDSVGNMVMDYIVDNQTAAIMQVALQQGVLPKPMGVQLRYLITHTKPIFGFSTYSKIPPATIVKGFSTYANYSTMPGQTLIYADLLKG